MNKLKKYLEEYLDSGMCQYEAPFIGRNDVTTMLKVFKALDKACHKLWVAEGMLFKEHSKTKDEWKEDLLNND